MAVMSRLPKPLYDIIDRHKGVFELEPRSKHLMVKINGEMIAVFSRNGNCKKTTLLNSAARLKRELKKRNLWREEQ